jgi:hypothetical protein
MIIPHHYLYSCFHSNFSRHIFSNSIVYSKKLATICSQQLWLAETWCCCESISVSKGRMSDLHIKHPELKAQYYWSCKSYMSTKSVNYYGKTKKQLAGKLGSCRIYCLICVKFNGKTFECNATKDLWRSLKLARGNGIAQSVEGLATGWVVRDVIFRTRPDWSWIPPNLYKGIKYFFSRGWSARSLELITHPHLVL